MFRYFKFTISRKLFASFFAVLILVAIFGGYILIFSQDAFEKLVGNNSIFLSESMIHRIDSNIFSKIDEFRQFSNDPLLRSELIESNKFFSNLNNVEEYIIARDNDWRSVPDETITEFMENIISSSLSDRLRNIFIQFSDEQYGYIEYSEVFITNKYGANIAQTGKTSDYYQADEVWWVDARNNTFSVGDFEYDDSSKVWSIPVGVSVVDSNGDFLGVIKAIVPVNTIINEAELVEKEYDSTEILLLTENGSTIYKTGAFRFLEDLSEKEFFQKVSQTRGFFVAESEGGEKLFSYAKSKGFRDFKGLGWVLVMSHSTNEIFSPILELRNVLIGAISMVLLLIIILAFFVSESISRPIKRLTQVSKKIAWGDLNKFVEVTSRDEVGELGKSFNEMTKNLSTAILDLKKSNARDDAILASLGNGLVVVDKSKSVIVINKSALNMVGYKEADIIGEKWPDIIGGIINDKNEVIEDKLTPLYNVLVKNKNIFTNKYVYKRSDGSSFNVEITAAPVLLSGNVIGGVIVFRDITEEKNAERIKNEFISLASHQLRTPLSSVNWITRSLLSKKGTKELNKEQSKHIQEIYSRIQGMIQLVNDLLNVSRVELGAFTNESTQTDLRIIIDDVLNEVKHLADNKKIKITKRFTKNIPLINIDSKMLRIAIQNLMTNAVKYTPENGEVSISLMVEEDKALIKISDNGYGIPENQQSKIFGKLFRADNIVSDDTGGTGLGLYLTKTIVERLGGKIWFESEENVRTTFFFTIPLDSKNNSNTGVD